MDFADWGLENLLDISIKLSDEKFAGVAEKSISAVKSAACSLDLALFWSFLDTMTSISDIIKQLFFALKMLEKNCR